MKTFLTALSRFLSGLGRPSKKKNTRLLHKRGETIESFIIREATLTDIPELAHLHVVTWNATYPLVLNKPTYKIREYQWRERFKLTGENWFCFVVQRPNGELIGFAQGNRYTGDLPGFAGELNKIYLLSEYQRLGLGRRLFGHVARRFLDQGVSSMLLFSEPQNPSCRFYEALRGEKIVAANGEFHGAYGWKDLQKLKAICSPE
jgi:ribosomal protein S18 acetylase RimI-like enzyme